MAVDPRLEHLPEHEGPAFRTWQLIMQTTMGSVVQQQQPSVLQINDGGRTKSKFAPGEEFIPLSMDNGTENSDKTSKRKKENEENNDTIFIPWKTREHYPEDPVGLHMEISDFYKYMSPLPEEESMRQNVVHRITALILNIWPSAKVEVFGSFKTKLYLPSSDIDLAVFGKWEKLPLLTLKKALIDNEVAEQSTIKVLDKATVPIIKLTDTKSKIRVDISFNVESSIESAELIKSAIEEYKILPALFLTVKHFLVMRDLNEVFTGGISSYCLMLLMISFLQRHPRIDIRKPTTNLGVLLMEFFELYGRNFNYQRIAIKVKGNGAYANKVELAKDLGEGTFLPLLCIEDPVTLSCDIGKSSYGILRVKETFEYAFNVIDIALRNKSYFKVNPNSTYLSRIVTVPKDLCQYREWVKTSYEPSEFVPKTVYTTVTTPIFQVGGAPPQYVTTNNGRSPLLPTPPSPFSSGVNIINSPFSPYPVTTNYGGALGFFDNNVVQPRIIIQNENTEIVSNQITSLQLNQPTEMAPPPQQVRYVVPYTQHKQQSYTPSTQMHSPIKTPNHNTIIAPLSNVLTSMVQQRRNNSFNNNKLNNNSSNYYNNNNKRGNNSGRNSQRNSPKTSPTLASREFSSVPLLRNMEYSTPFKDATSDNRQVPETIMQQVVAPPSNDMVDLVTPIKNKDIVSNVVDSKRVDNVRDDIIVISSDGDSS